MRSVAQVIPGGAEDPNEVESRMLEKAFVFRRENRVDQRRRQVLVAHGTVKEVGDEFRLDIGRAEFRSAVQWTDGPDGLARELHGDRVVPGKIGKLRGANVNGIALNGVLPERIVIGRRAVTYALKVLRQVVGTPDLACGDLFRRGKNLGGVLQDVAGQPGVNHSRVLDVIPGEDRGANEDNKEDDAKQGQTERGCPESFLDADTQVFSIGLKFYCLLSKLVWKARVRQLQHCRD